MRACTICGDPIVLSPSAAERAVKDVCGHTAAYYTSLFHTHADCELRKRKKDTAAFCRRLKREYYEKRVAFPLSHD